jgi:hypothetical protein
MDNLTYIYVKRRWWGRETGQAQQLLVYCRLDRSCKPRRWAQSDVRCTRHRYISLDVLLWSYEALNFCLEVGVYGFIFYRDGT